MRQQLNSVRPYKLPSFSLVVVLCGVASLKHASRFNVSVPLRRLIQEINNTVFETGLRPRGGLDPYASHLRPLV